MDKPSTTRSYLRLRIWPLTRYGLCKWLVEELSLSGIGRNEVGINNFKKRKSSSLSSKKLSNLCSLPTSATTGCKNKREARSHNTIAATTTSISVLLSNYHKTKQMVGNDRKTVSVDNRKNRSSFTSLGSISTRTQALEAVTRCCLLRATISDRSHSRPTIGRWGRSKKVSTNPRITSPSTTRPFLGRNAKTCLSSPKQLAKQHCGFNLPQCYCNLLANYNSLKNRQAMVHFWNNGSTLLSSLRETAKRKLWRSCASWTTIFTFYAFI